MKKILQPRRNCSGIFEVEQTGLLIDGRDDYRAFRSAAATARRYILIAGWQFDTDVELLRGKDAEEAGGEIALLPFLNDLCEKNSALRVYILAWDFSVLFALEREWFQNWTVLWTANERVHFRFDSSHAVGASQHQKLAVIDGQIAFVGGMDICSNRWDDRCHSSKNPYRVNSDGSTYGPYHEIQSYHVGSAALELANLFNARWVNSGGDPLHLAPPSGPARLPFDPDVAISADRVAFSRTRARTIVPLRNAIHEIRTLYLDAIRAAEELIYIENQYFSSRAVYRELKERVEKKGSKLQIVIVIPYTAEGILEEVSLRMVQSNMLYSLREIAYRNGHSLEVYDARSGGEKSLPTYIHSKLLLVDDRFLTVGSANTTNRSMGLDTELNVSWEADSPDQADLIRSIRRTRISLLAEHGGLRGIKNLRPVREGKRLIDYLNSQAEQPSSRLHRQPVETFFDHREWLRMLNLNDLHLDPKKALIEENILELVSKDPSGLFAGGIVLLNQWLSERPKAREHHPPKSPPRWRPALKKLFPVFRFLGHSRMVRWALLIFLGLLVAFLIRLTLKLL